MAKYLAGTFTHFFFLFTIVFQQNSMANPIHKKDLIVVADFGGESIAKYLPKKKENKTTRALNKPSHFPVVTTKMKLGVVGSNEATSFKFELLSKPLFIVGYDKISLHWLASNSKKLSDSGAIGLVVNVKTKEQLAEMQKIVGESVVLQPTHGDKLAEQLGIKHYPFYADSTGVMK